MRARASYWGRAISFGIREVPAWYFDGSAGRMSGRSVFGQSDLAAGRKFGRFRFWQVDLPAGRKFGRFRFLAVRFASLTPP